MSEPGKITSWLHKESKKHPEINSWLTKTFPDCVLGKNSFLTKLSQEEFNRLKGRWSSHLSRKKNKNLSCSISRETHKKLLTLKGKHSLKETIEVMITLTHQTQTPFNPILNQQKTIPLLTTFPTTHSATLPATPDNATSLAHIMQAILAIQQKLLFQMETISDLNKTINQLQKNSN